MQEKLEMFFLTNWTCSWLKTLLFEYTFLYFTQRNGIRSKLPQMFQCIYRFYTWICLHTIWNSKIVDNFYPFFTPHCTLFLHIVSLGLGHCIDSISEMLPPYFQPSRKTNQKVCPLIRLYWKLGELLTFLSM